MNKFLFLSFFIVLAHVSQAQITGKVFRDLNADGIQQANEPDIQGVVVNAFDATNTILNTTTTAANGSYSLPYTVPVRLEFMPPTTNNCSFPIIDYCGLAPNGNNVRFITSSTGNVDFAVQNPDDFNITPNPTVFVSRFNKGNPLLPGTAADTNKAVFGYPHTTNGSYVANASLVPNAVRTGLVGAVWGMAYSKHAKRLFCSAFIKRHSGLGPLGSGGIYMLEPNGNTFNVINFYDLDANGFRTRASASAVPFGLGTSFNITGNTTITPIGPIDPLTGVSEGLGVVGDNGPTGRKLLGSITYERDSSVFDQVGKVGLGDLEISKDGRFLFVMNLYSRQVLRLELNNVVNPTAVIAVDSFSIPNIPVNNGVLRPFALRFYRDKLYIGAISSGENGGQNIINGLTDLYAYVFEMTNPLTATPSINASPIFTLPLNYKKGGTAAGSSAAQWHPWTNNTATIPGNGEVGYPTPMLTEFDFNERGDLILAFTDRTGHQFGYSGAVKNLAGTGSISNVSQGDVLIAGMDSISCVYTVENNGSYTSNGTAYTGFPGNNQGIGGGEFFEDQGTTLPNETEGSQGSLALMPGQSNFMFTMMDVQGLVNAGTCKLSTVNGIKSNALVMASGAQFGKSNSMGDIEISGDIPQIQIGNRVWKDENGNGIQDPTDIGIANVGIDLYADFNKDSIPDGALLANTNTDANGQYYFDQTNVPDGDPTTPGNQPGLLAYRNYLLRIAPSDWSSGAGTNELLTYSVTVADIGGPGQPDVRDNDGKLFNNVPVILAFTEMNSKNIFDNDFGFNQCKIPNLSDVYLDCNVTSIKIGPDSIPGTIYSWLPPTGLSATNIAQPIANPSSTTTYTLTADVFCTKTVTVNVDQTPPPANAGIATALDCTTKQTVIGTPAISGLTYSWAPTTGLDNPNIAQPTASPTTTTTYTVTVKGLNGCTSTSTVKVPVESCCTKVTMANSFSPNGDNINDTYGVIEIKDLQAFKLRIYNRFGEEVFFTNNKDKKWDGKYKGGDCDLGTYYYLLIYECGGTKQQLQGDVNLIR